MATRLKRIKRILVANRGEIAVRIIRTCRELGIETVSVFSDADHNALHIVLSEFGERLPGNTPQETYLNIPLLIDICKKYKVDAVHPGYGFLAENEEFAQALSDEKIIFIGPTPKNVHDLGDKLFAKKTAQSVGVPVISGTEKPVTTVDEARSFAKKHGLPLIIKAAAGGGGRGMRIVQKESDLETTFHSAQSEAQTAFGSNALFLERYVENPKHIEFQILADQFGNVIHLGERECSIQRRYQKLIEEAPSPALSPSLRMEMGESAVRIAKASGYINAGTVEFLLDNNKNYFFIEMNTRLQVEHPVTEMVTNTDLVREQIYIAEGRELSYTQEDIRFSGHSIEARINAEDPLKNFIPTLGKINRFIPPMGNGIRLDTHVYEGYTVPIYYDSLIGKLISHGNTREVSINKMLRALGEFIITGIKTTIPFHQYVMSHPAFLNAEFTTSFVDRYFNAEEIKKFLTGKFEERNIRRVAIASALSYILAQRQTMTISEDSSAERKQKLSSWNEPFGRREL